MNCIRALCASILLCAICIVTAATQVDTFTASVPVANQSASVRQQALKQALSRVLIKTSGNVGVATIPSIQLQLAQAKSLVQTYSYQTDEQQLLLDVTFDADAVKKLLRKQHQAIWGATRPSILTWVVMSTPQQTIWLDKSLPSPLLTVMQKQCQQRGLPLMLPSFDMQDAVTTQVDLQKPLSYMHFREASSRYHPDVVLVGHITQLATQYQARWQFVLNGRPIAWRTAGKDVNAVVSALTDRLTGVLSAQYATLNAPLDQSAQQILVQGMQSIADVAKVTRYLTQLVPVASVATQSFSGDSVTFNIQLSGTQEAFADAIALDHRLKLLSNINSRPIVFQWQGGL
ncbi:MAG: hypothetical protein DHS20C10_08680 [marine bacterium B5-7]|nr:MAG: hypothetical protein DHS20C10_08680 [marine bacterium B5-7]